MRGRVVVAEGQYTPPCSSNSFSAGFGLLDASATYGMHEYPGIRQCDNIVTFDDATIR